MAVGLLKNRRREGEAVPPPARPLHRVQRPVGLCIGRRWSHTRSWLTLPGEVLGRKNARNQHHQVQKGAIKDVVVMIADDLQTGKAFLKQPKVYLRRGIFIYLLFSSTGEAQAAGGSGFLAAGLRSECCTCRCRRRRLRLTSGEP